MHTQKTAHHSREPRQFKKSNVALVFALVGVCTVAVFAMPNEWHMSSAETKEEQKEQESLPKKPVAEHVPTPEPLKGIYMSQCVVGTPSFREKLVKLIDDTQLNAVVIDIKDYTGKIGFTTENPILKDSVSDA